MGRSKMNMDRSETNIGRSETNIGRSKTNIGRSKMNMDRSKTKPTWTHSLLLIYLVEQNTTRWFISDLPYVGQKRSTTGLLVRF